MGETFLFGFVEEMCKKLTSLALQEIKLVWGFKDECRRLLETSSAIEAALLDAEKRQAHSNSERLWLKRLQDVMDDISNVVDDMATEDLRRRVENQFLDKVTHFLSQPDQSKMCHKIKIIKKRLDDIYKDAQQFNFIKTETDMGVAFRGRETYSYVRQSEIVGRDNDRENIVLKLLEGPSNCKLSVIPIMGMGGLGKTTLAQLVYNDKRVKAQFEQKMWVHVSTNFSLRKIIEDIVARQNSHLPLERLQKLLREKLGGKKFLLVLDDVWIREPGEWKELRDLLMVGANGSKIVITTREELVARIVGGDRYILEGLSENDCWCLFVKHAFEEGKEKEHQELEDIGMKIARKSGGVPLAVKTLGGMLFSKTDKEEWLSVLNSDIWEVNQSQNGIMPILKLSFDRLPESYMKRCFAYCAVILLKGGISFKSKENMVQLWMAQGLIPSSCSDRQCEHLGNQCFNELSARSFFQVVKESDQFLQTKFEMHDLMHDLARSVLGDEFSVIDLGTTNIPPNVRHVSAYDFTITPRPKFPESLFKLKKLRTFVWICGNFHMEKSIPINPIISSFSYLRVLDLSLTSFEDLPSSIEKLKNLRYLNICRNPLIKGLPKSICKLYNLRTLKLNHVKQLQELPKGMWKLISLRHLEVTSKQRSFRERGIGCVTSLRTLSIIECNFLVSLPNSMQCLGELEDLLIWSCSELSFSERDMQGLSSLRRLSLISLPKMMEIPQGLQQSATNTPRVLYIENCSGLSTLPEWLGSFTSLERLTICECPNLKSLPEGMRLLTTLKELSIGGCPDLMRRCEQEIGEDWHKIAHVPKICLEDITSSESNLSWADIISASFES